MNPIKPDVMSINILLLCAHCLHSSYPRHVALGGGEFGQSRDMIWENLKGLQNHHDADYAHFLVKSIYNKNLKETDKESSIMIVSGF